MEIYKPLISVIVPLYNAEKMLNCCLDSLVFQTLENIEIIIVEKQSTDNSLDIAKVYTQQYPNKVKLFEIPYSDSPATGRNYGISKSSADYIAFSDSDDFWDLNAMKVLHDHIKENASDIVMFYAHIVSKGKIVGIDKHINTNNISQSICYDSGMCTMWNRLWKKEFLLSMGDIPELARGEDIVFVPTAISNAKTISSLPKALYYYNWGIGLCNSDRHEPNTIGLLDAWDTLIKSNYNKKYQDEIFTFLARRIDTTIKSRPRFFDDFVTWVMEHKYLFTNNTVLMKRDNIYRNITKYISNYHDMIPKTIYLNGFLPLDEKWIEHIKSNVFNARCENIVILDEYNCDITGNKWIEEAYKSKKFNLLGHYFAIKKIYETGGIFINHNIKITISLNYFRQFKSFFTRLDNETISDDIFGAVANSDVINDLIFTYENLFYEDINYSLANRIKNILIVKYDFSFDSNDFFRKAFVMFAPNKLVIDLNDQENFCVHNQCYISHENKYRLIEEKTFEWLTNKHIQAHINNVKNLRNKNNILRSEKTKLYYENESLRSENKRLKLIENSTSWRLLRRLFSFFDNTKSGKLLKIPLKALINSLIGE